MKTRDFCERSLQILFQLSNIHMISITQIYLQIFNTSIASQNFLRRLASVRPRIEKRTPQGPFSKYVTLKKRIFQPPVTLRNDKSILPTLLPPPPPLRDDFSKNVRDLESNSTYRRTFKRKQAQVYVNMITGARTYSNCGSNLKIF